MSVFNQPSRRPPITHQPRPLTGDESQVATSVLGQKVTQSWLARRGIGALELLCPPSLTPSERRRGAMADLSRWIVTPAPQLDDPTVYNAALVGTKRYLGRHG